MIQNYIKIALRNLSKNRMFTALNITGLSLGITACLLIALYITNEIRYDRWNPNADRVVRVVSDIKFGGNEMHLAVVGTAIGPDCGRELPEVQNWCRIRESGTYLIKRDGEGQQNFKEETVLSADSTFFSIFPRNIIEGDASKALTQPKTLAMSRSAAEKYFSAPQLALGKTLVLENEERWQVTAIFEDFPEQTHFKADFLLALNGNQEMKEAPTLWGANNNWQTYLLLHKSTDAAGFAQKFESLARQKIAITAQQMLNMKLEDFEKTGQYVHLSLQKLTDIHLHSDRTAELAVNGSYNQVRFALVIAAFILFIACINFMNLATARSAGRAREVGVRKSLGSVRGQIMSQFLIESILLAMAAVALSALFAHVLMPTFNNLTDRALAVPWLSVPFWAILAGVSVMIGVLAGAYPAFFLSAFNAVRVLKGEVAGLGRGGVFRNTLVVFQFSASVALIVATALVYQQLNYIQNKRLGFEKRQVVILEGAYALGDKTTAFKSEMLNNPSVESATMSGFLPVPSYRSDNGFSKERSINVESMVSMQNWRVDADYIRTMGMELVAGRDFDANSPADSNAVILNESAARLFGFTGDPSGKKIYSLDGPPQGGAGQADFTEFNVVGIVKDFHFSSFREQIDALCLRNARSSGMMSFRFKGENAASVVSALEKNWKAMAPGQPFSYKFMDDSFAKTYRSEQRFGSIAGVFALLSVVISCLGLFGLAAYATERRRKEIGVRKVLGASVSGITALLAKDFLKPVVVAILIASPVAYYFMDKWLANFAYHIDIQWWMFTLAGILAVAIAALTVGAQSMKAALDNPVNSLRSE